MLYIHAITRESVLKGGPLDDLVRRWKASGGDANALVALIDENRGWKEPEKGSDQVALDWFEENSLIDIDPTGKVPSRIHHHRGDEYTESQLFII